MKLDYTPALCPRGPSTLRCGHTDCCYYTARTDSCDYLLIEFEPRGCPPAADCARYAPSRCLRKEGSDTLAAHIQAYLDMGLSTRQIARRLRVCVPSLRRLRARGAAGARGGGIF